jgi:hypothetical protein
MLNVCRLVFLVAVMGMTVWSKAPAPKFRYEEEPKRHPRHLWGRWVLSSGNQVWDVTLWPSGGYEATCRKDDCSGVCYRGVWGMSDGDLLINEWQVREELSLGFIPRPTNNIRLKRSKVVGWDWECDTYRMSKGVY